MGYVHSQYTRAIAHEIHQEIQLHPPASKSDCLDAVEDIIHRALEQQCSAAYKKGWNDAAGRDPPLDKSPDPPIA